MPAMYVVVLLVPPMRMTPLSLVVPTTLAPMSMLLLPEPSWYPAKYPRAVLLLPVATYRDSLPIAVFSEPVLFMNIASNPNPLLLLPVVLKYSGLKPCPVLYWPLVIRPRVDHPVAVLSLPVGLGRASGPIARF